MWRPSGFPERSLRSRGRGPPSGLVDLLRARGYAPEIAPLVMVGPLSPEADAQVKLSSIPDENFRKVLFGVQHRGDGDAAERLAVLSRIPAPVGFATLDLDERPCAVGVCAVEGEWAGLSAMRTLDHARRRGLARRLIGALHAFATDAGASRGYLQVEAQNAPAIALYRAMGFAPEYAYRHWRRG